MTPSDAAPAGRARAARGEEGLVLLEILVALAIFTFVVLAWLQASDSAVAAAAAANQERRIRMLAARKLDEVRSRPEEFRDGGEGGFEEEVGEDGENPFLDYAWKVEAKEVVAAGHSTEEGAEFLFAKDEEEEGTASGGAGGGAERPPAIVLLRLRLTVSHIPQGADGEEFRVTALVPLPPGPK